MAVPAGHTAYKFRLAGHLDNRWAPWFGGLTLTHEADGTTSLVAQVQDQAALHGLLCRIRDLGLTLISLEVQDRPGNNSNLRP